MLLSNLLTKEQSWEHWRSSCNSAKNILIDLWAMAFYGGSINLMGSKAIFTHFIESLVLKQNVYYGQKPSTKAFFHSIISPFAVNVPIRQGP